MSGSCRGAVRPLFNELHCSSRKFTKNSPGRSMVSTLPAYMFPLHAGPTLKLPRMNLQAPRSVLGAKGNVFFAVTVQASKQPTTVIADIIKQTFSKREQISSSTQHEWPVPKFTFMHLVDTFIQSDLQCIQAIHFFVSMCVPWESNPQHLCC